MTKWKPVATAQTWNMRDLVSSPGSAADLLYVE